MKENRFIKIIKKIHGAIEAVTIYSFLIILLLYIVGQFIKLNIVIDDLILKDIKRQLPKNTKILFLKQILKSPKVQTVGLNILFRANPVKEIL